MTVSARLPTTASSFLGMCYCVLCAVGDTWCVCVFCVCCARARTWSSQSRMWQSEAHNTHSLTHTHTCFLSLPRVEAAPEMSEINDCRLPAFVFSTNTNGRVTQRGGVLRGWPMGRLPFSPTLRVGVHGGVWRWLSNRPSLSPLRSHTHSQHTLSHTHTQRVDVHGGV